jgi:hypothetical protein
MRGLRHFTFSTLEISKCMPTTIRRSWIRKLCFNLNMSTVAGMPNTTTGVTGAYPFEGSVELFQVSDDQRLPVHLSGDRNAALAVSTGDRIAWGGTDNFNGISGHIRWRVDRRHVQRLVRTEIIATGFAARFHPVRPLVSYCP